MMDWFTDQNLNWYCYYCKKWHYVLAPQCKRSIIRWDTGVFSVCNSVKKAFKLGKGLSEKPCISDKEIWLYARLYRYDTTYPSWGILYPKELLFISYKFVKGFLANTFLLLVFFELTLSWSVWTSFI